MFKHSVTIPMYITHIDLIIGNDEETEKHRRDFDARPYMIGDAECINVGWYKELNGYKIIIHLQSNSLILLVHELYHCVSCICANIGAEIDCRNDETQAYLYDYIFGELYRANAENWHLEINKE